MLEAAGPDTKLGYCTNVHGGATYAQTLENLQRYAVAVREQIGAQGPLGIGLWLSAQAAREVVEQNRVAELRDWLGERGLCVFTMNGFPHGNFHEKVVKRQVYRPRWNEAARYRYTLDLVHILSGLLPEGSEGSISTLPVGWRKEIADDVEQRAAAQQLLDVMHRLARVELDTGRYIHLNLEPEPGCLLDTSAQVVQYFKQYLLNNADEQSVRAYLKVCHDVCHAAVMFEGQAGALQRYRQAGIKVGKVQLSSAIEVNFEAMSANEREAGREQLQAFCEPRYLHQTMVSNGQAARFYEDLPDALAAEAARGQWRVHFHVPLFVQQFGAIGTTQQQVIDCVKAIEASDEVKHFEVETYAWDVLPQGLGGEDLASGIARELEWVAQELRR